MLIELILFINEFIVNAIYYNIFITLLFIGITVLINVYKKSIIRIISSIIMVISSYLGYIYSNKISLEPSSPLPVYIKDNNYYITQVFLVIFMISICIIIVDLIIKIIKKGKIIYFVKSPTGLMIEVPKLPKENKKKK